MRIAFLSQEVPGINDEGGIGYHFLLLGRAFTKRGHDVTLFYDGEKELEIDGVKIKGVWRKSWMWRMINKATSTHELLRTIIWSVGVRRALAKQTPFDVIELPEFHSSPWMIPSKNVVVMSLHGGKRQTAELNDDFTRLRDRCLALLEKKAVHAANHLYAVSEMQAEYATRTFQRSVPRWFPNPVDTDRFSPVKRGNSVHDVPYIVFVGRIEHRKGVATLLESYASVADEVGASMPDLICIGDDYYQLGPQRNLSLIDYLQREVPAALARKIHYLPHLPQEKLVEYYRAAEFCVFPSIEEPFGNVIAEAMSCGKVVVITERCGISSWVVNGKNALISGVQKDAFSQKLKEAVQMSIRKRNAIGRVARETAQRTFSLDSAASKIEEFYREITTTSSS